MLFQYLVLSSDFNVDIKNFKFVFFKIYIFSSRIKKMDLINNMTVNSHFHLFNHLENLLMLNKKECKLTLYSQNAFRKQPLHFAIHSNKLYENYNINQYNESYATIQKKKPRYTPINHQIFFKIESIINGLINKAIYKFILLYIHKYGFFCNP